MKNIKFYEIKVSVRKKIRVYPVRAYSMEDAIRTIAHHKEFIYIVSVSEITCERFHILELAEAIADSNSWVNCESECSELCHYAGYDVEWHEADGDTFENVVYKAAKKLGVDI